MKKNKLILLQLFIVFALICTSVYATFSTTIELSVSDKNVSKGGKVSVTLSLKDVDSNQKVESVSGYINYNKDIIEALDSNSIQMDKDNNVKIGNETLKVEDVTNLNPNELPDSSSHIIFNREPSTENDSRIVIDFKDGIKEDTDLITIDFKVKSDASIGEIKNAISYSMFVVTAESGETEVITKNIDLTIKEVSNPDDDKNENVNKDTNQNTNTDKEKNENVNKNENKNTNTNKNANKNVNNSNTNTNKNQNTNKNTNTNTNKNVNTNKDNTVAGTKIPAAGAKVVIVPAIILIIVAYISYNRYMKYKDI